MIVIWGRWTGKPHIHDDVAWVHGDALAHRLGDHAGQDNPERHAQVARALASLQDIRSQASGIRADRRSESDRSLETASSSTARSSWSSQSPLEAGSARRVRLIRRLHGAHACAPPLRPYCALRMFRPARGMLRIPGLSKSGRQDLNLRPPGPQPGALPDCATPRGAAHSRRAAGSPRASLRTPPVRSRAAVPGAWRRRTAAPE